MVIIKQLVCAFTAVGFFYSTAHAMETDVFKKYMKMGVGAASLAVGVYYGNVAQARDRQYKKGTSVGGGHVGFSHDRSLLKERDAACNKSLVFVFISMCLLSQSMRR